MIKTKKIAIKKINYFIILIFMGKKVKMKFVFNFLMKTKEIFFFKDFNLCVA